MFVNILLNKSENNNNKYVGWLTAMHWQVKYARNLTKVSIYEVTHNENVYWYNISLPPATMHSHSMAAATLMRTAKSLQCSGYIPTIT